VAPIKTVILALLLGGDYNRGVFIKLHESDFVYIRHDRLSEADLSLYQDRFGRWAGDLMDEKTGMAESFP